MSNHETYQQRRLALGRKYDRTLFIIPSGSEAFRSHSVRYRFKAASDFAYLCGLHLADSILVIVKDKTYLLHEECIDHVWGEHTDLSAEHAHLLKGMQIESKAKLETILQDHLHSIDRWAVSLGRDSKLEQTILAAISYGRKFRSVSAKTIVDSRTLVGAIRAIKTADEIQNLKEAGIRSSRVHRRLMETRLEGKTEREICNWIEGGFLLENMQWTAYETIVGSGERSTLLHARASDRVVQKGELVLVDAGGEWKGYCADITRTLSASVTFTSAQSEIYRAVLAAQKQAISLVKPGRTLKEIHDCAAHSLAESLANLGVKDAQKQPGNLMPHSTSHWMGMDVHDPAPYHDDAGQALKLEEGMVFTVEPGLYFRDRSLSEKYYGIGVRIEDDVVVTQTGCDLLSSAPKEIEEVLELRARSGA